MLVPVVLSGLVSSAAHAGEDAKPATSFAASGQYSAANLYQRNFLLGADHALDDAHYSVQLLRVRLEATRGRFGVVARADAAQGFWGVDDTPNADDDTYNPSGLFPSKDANHELHVDLAYVWADLGPWRAQIGRMPFLVGHQLVLDEELEGVQVAWKGAGRLSVEALWAKVSEGEGSATDPLPGLQFSSDAAPRAGDADVGGIRARLDREAVKGEIFALLWHDETRRTDQWTHLPQGLGYKRSRFAPNVSDLVAVGVAASGTHGGLTWKAEADWLRGRDLVRNEGFQDGLLDVNDGVLTGGNAYADVQQAFELGVPLLAGVTLGMGSGDEDPRSGHGNVNRMSTMGFFPLLNVWEDSVMPDIEGISPQGLGSPVSRGYRELENTMVAAARVGADPVERLHVEVVGAGLLATEPVHAFDWEDVPVDRTARRLGAEIDANATLTVLEGLQVRELAGVFLPGRAAAYVINGNAATLDPAWELRTEVLAKF
jgi:hypothetical protein